MSYVAFQVWRQHTRPRGVFHDRGGHRLVEDVRGVEIEKRFMILGSVRGLFFIFGNLAAINVIAITGGLPLRVLQKLIEVLCQHHSRGHQLVRGRGIQISTIVSQHVIEIRARRI